MARSTGLAFENLGIAAHHDGQRRRLGARGPAADGRLQEVQAARLRGRLQLARRGRQHAAEIDQDRSGAGLLDEAAGAQVEPLDVGRHRQARQDDLGGLDDVVHGGGGARPGLDQVLHRPGALVEDRQGEAGLQHVARHGIAHVSDADEAYRDRHRHFLRIRRMAG
jgi:hypothetical protein